MFAAVHVRCRDVAVGKRNPFGIGFGWGLRELFIVSRGFGWFVLGCNGMQFTTWDVRSRVRISDLGGRGQFLVCGNVGGKFLGFFFELSFTSLVGSALFFGGGKASLVVRKPPFKVCDLRA